MNKRIPRKEGQPAKSDKHSDLYTDEDPKGTIQGLQFKNKRAAALSVAKIKRSNRSHNHKTQAAIAMEQRAEAMTTHTNDIHCIFTLSLDLDSSVSVCFDVAAQPPFPQPICREPWANFLATTIHYRPLIR